MPITKKRRGKKDPSARISKLKEQSGKLLTIGGHLESKLEKIHSKRKKIQDEIHSLLRNVIIG